METIQFKFLRVAYRLTLLGALSVHPPSKVIVNLTDGTQTDALHQIL